MSSSLSVFDLPDRLAAKRDPGLIAEDEAHFHAIESSLQHSIAELEERLDQERRAPAGSGQQALERDLEVHRLTARLRTLRRYGLDLCLGRMVTPDETVYIGRLGLTASDGSRLLVDWRSPAAEPFFGATRAEPSGLISRRRYRWSRGRIVDYWDEVFTEGGIESTAALDDQSAFIASLGSSRSSRMRDVLATLQSDQDAIVRAPASGALVVDGGPGTGKTVVALHRTAYLLYSDDRVSRGGVLFVGPSQGYLGYVDDVLPSLGEETVQNCTIRELVPEGADAMVEPDQRVAALKGAVDAARIIEAAAAWYERPPTRGLVVETEWADILLDADDWAEAFESAERGAQHNEARDQVWERLLEILLDRHGDEVPEELLRRALTGNAGLRQTFATAWPLLDPVGVVADLWSAPGFLTLCAPSLAESEVELLQRADARAWTASDLPFLDLARRRIGDPDANRRRREREAVFAEEREQRGQVIDHLIESDDSEELLMHMFRHQAFADTLIDEGAAPAPDPDALVGPFAHIVVDEAQELTRAEWQMLLSRCPSRSFTIVGDRAQARAGFAESWQQRLERVGFDHIGIVTLGINYRTPEEVMAVAEPVIRSAIPDANVPVSIRSSGVPVRYGAVAELDAVVEQWMSTNDDGIACVIGVPDFTPSDRVRSLSPQSAKGLEFDLVVLVAPERYGPVDLYVSMTRATQELVILGGPDGPGSGGGLALPL